MGTRFHGDNRDPAVNVTNLVLLVVFILAVIVRLGTKLRLFRQFTNDDYFMIVALVRACAGARSSHGGLANSFWRRSSGRSSLLRFL